MKVLFYLKEGYAEFLCPLCFNLIDCEDSYENDDYVASNCLLWCFGHCSEMLLCMKGENTKNTDIRDGVDIFYDKFDESRKCKSRCTRKVPKQFIESYFDGLMKKHDDSEIQDKLEKARQVFIEKENDCFVTGLLSINKIINFAYDSDLESDLDNEIAEKSSQFSYDSGVKGTKTYDVPDLLCFRDIEAYNPKIDLSHDGFRLGYEAECSECGENNKSYIWGD